MKRRDFLTLCGLAAGSVLIPAPIACLKHRLNELDDNIHIEIR
jgi:hypothetical protein